MVLVPSIVLDKVWSISALNIIYSLPTLGLLKNHQPAVHGHLLVDSYQKQIDFICVNNKFRNSVTNAQSRPGSYCGSDHNPVIINMRLKLKKPARKTMAKKWDVNKTKCPQNKINFTVRVNEKRVKVNNDSYSGTHIEENWNNLKFAISSTAEEVVGFDRPRPNRNG